MSVFFGSFSLRAGTDAVISRYRALLKSGRVGRSLDKRETKNYGGRRSRFLEHSQERANKLLKQDDDF